MRVILLPGMDGAGTLHGDFVSALGPGFDVTSIAYPLDCSLSYVELEDFVRSRLPQDEPFLLLAESFSGPIAVSLSATNPAELAGLVLVATYVRNARPFIARFAPLARLLPFDWPAAVALIAPLLFGRWNTKTLRHSLADALARVSRRVLAARLSEAARIDVTERLAKVTVPLLYIQATHDHIVPAAAGRLVTRLAPEIRVVQIEGPHFLLQAVPEPCARAVIEFVRNHPVRPA